MDYAFFCYKCGNKLKDDQEIIVIDDDDYTEDGKKSFSLDKNLNRQSCICPYCQEEILHSEEKKICPACKIPHHTVCWQENGNTCTTYGCGGDTQQISSALRSHDYQRENWRNYCEQQNYQPRDEEIHYGLYDDRVVACNICGQPMRISEGCLHCRYNSFHKQSLNRKSYLLYVILALLFGAFGIHNFYEGKIGYGLLKLLFTVFLGGFFTIFLYIWIIIEILTFKDS